jgi:hypothetical protein
MRTKREEAEAEEGGRAHLLDIRARECNGGLPLRLVKELLVTSCLLVP